MSRISNVFNIIGWNWYVLHLIGFYPTTTLNIQSSTFQNTLDCKSNKISSKYTSVKTKTAGDCEWLLLRELGITTYVLVPRLVSSRGSNLFVVLFCLAKYYLLNNMFAVRLLRPGSRAHVVRVGLRFSSQNATDYDKEHHQTDNGRTHFGFQTIKESEKEGKGK